MSPVAVASSSSDGNAIRYVLPVLCMTSCFHITKRMGRFRDDAYVSSSSLGGGTGDKVCHLRLHLVLWAKMGIKARLLIQCCKGHLSKLMSRNILAHFFVHKVVFSWMFLFYVAWDLVIGVAGMNEIKQLVRTFPSFPRRVRDVSPDSIVRRTCYRSATCKFRSSHSHGSTLPRSVLDR